MYAPRRECGSSCLLVGIPRTESLFEGNAAQKSNLWYLVFQAILEGIRKGEIVSSGAVHNSAPKEGSLNRGMRQDSLGRGRGRGRGAGTLPIFQCRERVDWLLNSRVVGCACYFEIRVKSVFLVDGVMC